MTDVATLRTWLTEAETARHKLATGSLVEELRHGETRTKFTTTDMEKLEAYIASLKSQIAVAEGTAASRRRPITLTY